MTTPEWDEALSHWADEVRKAAHEAWEKRERAIEQACEEALQGGVCGVLVIDRPDSTFVAVDESVPYGLIHIRQEDDEQA